MIKGIVFNCVQFFHYVFEPNPNIANLYSSSIVSQDSAFNINNRLEYFFPALSNVLGNACNVAKVCSKTMKYNGFCKQIYNVDFVDLYYQGIKKFVT